MNIPNSHENLTKIPRKSYRALPGQYPGGLGGEPQHLPGVCGLRRGAGLVTNFYAEHADFSREKWVFNQ